MTLAWIVTWLLLAACVPCVHAQALDAAPGEQISMIPAGGSTEPELEVTMFKPEGDGPFPVVVINHGRARQCQAAAALPPAAGRARIRAARLRVGGADAPGFQQIRWCRNCRRLQCAQQRCAAGALGAPRAGLGGPEAVGRRVAQCGDRTTAWRAHDLGLRHRATPGHPAADLRQLPLAAGTVVIERRLTGIIDLDDSFRAAASADRLSSYDPNWSSSPSGSLLPSRHACGSGETVPSKAAKA